MPQRATPRSGSACSSDARIDGAAAPGGESKSARFIGLNEKLAMQLREVQRPRPAADGRH